MAELQTAERGRRTYARVAGGENALIIPRPPGTVLLLGGSRNLALSQSEEEESELASVTVR